MIMYMCMDGLSLNCHYDLGSHVLLEYLARGLQSAFKNALTRMCGIANPHVV